MKKVVLQAAVMAVSLVCAVSAQTFAVKAVAGSVQVFKTSAGVRSTVADVVTIGMGDSVILDEGSQAVIGLEVNTRLIFRGPGALALSGDSSSAYISFEKGQVFLERSDPASFSVLTFWVRNYMFVPAGTAASIRVMANGFPAVAVLKGKMLMQSPTGESAEIPAGKFGLVETSGRITAGTLGKSVIAALERWSGVRAGAEISPDRKSSSDAIDIEIIGAVATAPPPGRSVSPQAVSGTQTQKNAAIRERPSARTPATPAPATAPSAPKQTFEKTAAPAPAAQRPAAQNESSGGEQVGAEKTAAGESGAPAQKTSFEISAGSVTVDNQQWTRIALGVDVPIWKFGIFFDLEAFLTADGKFSNKGWDFENDPLTAAARKIRYIRFGYEQDPLFVKIGGLSSVTLGYGFIVDRFTNMLHYPEQKLLGLQLYVNNVTPAGITLQFVGADFQELRTRDHGGVGAVRLAVRPLKTLDVPVLKGLAIGGTYGYDRNTYAPARQWRMTGEEKLVQSAFDRGILPDTGVVSWLKQNGYNPEAAMIQIEAEKEAKKRVAPFGIFGADISVPLITAPPLSLDLYGQSGMRDDSIHGWGIGAPGLALTVWKINASVEYRHVEGRFVPGFFGPYYLDERLVRDPFIMTKAEMLADDTLNGVFGRLGFDVFGALTLNGAYQYLTGSTSRDKDQRFELTGTLGPLVIGKIPKVKMVEGYLYKTHIGTDIVRYDSAGVPVMSNGDYTYDAFFDKTPYMYYGFRLGVGITEGATLIWESRYGWTRNGRGALVSNNNITVQTAFTF